MPVMTQATPTARYIDPNALLRIRSLELRVKAVMEGFVTGLHRSPFHGFSVEFTEYRQFTNGDDPRFLDWKVVARSDRFYIKRFEDETNLRCHLLVDNSRSMSYGSSGYSKADYGKTLAACLAYSLSQQRDAVGLVMFDERVEDLLPARFRHGQLRQILVSLERAAGGQSTNLVEPLERVAAQVRKRGLVILISDLLAPTDGLERALTALSACGHELAVFQTLDPRELDFGFDNAALFVDQESGRELYVDPAATRTDYKRKLDAHLTELRTICEKLGAIYHLVPTDQPLEILLGEFFTESQRLKARGRRGRR